MCLPVEDLAKSRFYEFPALTHHTVSGAIIGLEGDGRHSYAGDIEQIQFPRAAYAPPQAGKAPRARESQSGRQAGARTAPRTVPVAEQEGELTMHQRAETAPASRKAPMSTSSCVQSPS